MAHVADHLSVSALEQQYRSCTDVTAARHLQTIWLLAKGHEIAEVAATVSYAQRWVERLLARYNAQGPQALGDLRRRNGTSPSILRPDLLEKLKARLLEPPPDGGLWTSPKVAAWMAGELGLAAAIQTRALQDPTTVAIIAKDVLGSEIPVLCENIGPQPLELLLSRLALSLALGRDANVDGNHRHGGSPRTDASDRRRRGPRLLTVQLRRGAADRLCPSACARSAG